MITKSNITGWKWRSSHSREFQLPFYHFGEPLILESNAGNVLVVVNGGTCLIERHYHFDGATWAPDFKDVLPATALHDALLQLHEKYPDDLSEQDAHEAFLLQMQRDEFALANLYYWAVSSWPRKLYKLIKG